MWNGKKKAVTFSFDDGVTQDIRLIALFNKYGLKGTFNLNSSLFGLPGSLECFGRTVSHNKVMPSEVKSIYEGHEVAVHTLVHPNLTQLEKEAVIYQVEEDRKALEAICGYPIVGMAYPCGGVNNDERTAEIIRKNTKIAYARTITSTYSFSTQKENLHRFHPTIHSSDDRLEEIVDDFLENQEEGLLYIWGHSYEMDAGRMTWEKLEEILQKLSGKEDIFYGTNKEVLL